MDDLESLEKPLESLRKQLERAERVLTLLEENLAAYAPSETPPHKQIELEDQRRAVKKLRDEIARLQAPGVSPQVISSSPKWDRSKLEPYKQWKEHHETDDVYRCLLFIISLLDESLALPVQEQDELYSQLPEEDLIELLAAVYAQSSGDGIYLHKRILVFLDSSAKSQLRKQLAYFRKTHQLLKGFFTRNTVRKVRAALRLWENSIYGTIGREITVYHLSYAFQNNPEKVINLYGEFRKYHPGLLINDSRLKELHETVNPPYTSAGHRPWEFVFSSEFVIPHNPPSEPHIDDWLHQHAFADQDPFSDWRSPLKDNAWLSNQSWSKPYTLEAELDNIHSIYHKLYSVDETWDMEASCCRLINDIGSNNLYQNTAFIVLFRTKPLYSSNTKPEEIIFRGIAHQWISYLLYHPRLFFNISESDQIKLIELLVRVYGTFGKVEAEFNKQKAAIDNYHRWIDELMNSKQDVDWPLLYPRDEPHQRQQETTNLVKRIKKLTDHLRMVSDESPDAGNEHFFELSLSLRPAWLEKTILLFSLPDPLEDIGNQNSRDLPSALKSLLALSPKLAAHQAYFRGFTKNEYLDFQLPSNIEHRVLRWDQDSLLDCLSRRTKLVSEDNLQSFDSLFSRRTVPSPSTILAQCAAGSPGKLVRLGHKLLTSHIQNTPKEEQIDPDSLNSITS